MKARKLHTRSSCGVRVAAVARAQRKLNLLIGEPPEFEEGTLTAARNRYYRLEKQFTAALEERKLARKLKCPLCKQYAKKGGR